MILKIVKNKLTIDNPHQKDIVQFTLTAKNIGIQAYTVGVTGACFTFCAYLLTEVGDHTASVVCYAVCGALTGSTTYTTFRKLFQKKLKNNYSFQL